VKKVEVSKQSFPPAYNLHPNGSISHPSRAQCLALLFASLVWHSQSCNMELEPGSSWTSSKTFLDILSPTAHTWPQLGAWTCQQLRVIGWILEDPLCLCPRKKFYAVNVSLVPCSI